MLPRPVHLLFLLLAFPLGGFAQVLDVDYGPAIKYLQQEAGAIGGDEARFVALTQPYAPLAFQVRQASNSHASAVRNYLFRVASASAGMAGTVAPKMANDFHCGQPCASTRIQKFMEQHEAVSALVMSFVPLGKVVLVAQWGTAGDFRLNDTFVRGGTITTFQPAGTIGILPNSAGVRASKLTEASGLTVEELSQAKLMVDKLAALHLAAIVRSSQGIRVIRTGNADNQSGLLFKRLSVAPPKAKDSFGEGLDLDGVTMLAQDIYYFETN